MATVVTVVVGVFFLAMGSYALAAPAALIRPFGIRLEQPAARYEVRAVYGGFGLAMAAMLAIAATHDGPLRTGIMVTIGVALGGMAFGRIVSAVLDDRISFYPNWFYCVIEAVAAASLIATA
ncbi:DUF4345 domain-containing protein [Nocardia sp. NBC_00565]|uniref:DUF4345 family protein n=1 Tax=Nocardia sp. NBC_00565 TaxID=2975993 RepID=UPI002E7FDBBC|nr:DUF4345 family protein [Nocardia sp. NBC_00565]WUC07210.1 DUF4345 domain-containing protein [Nocardia sp. NBC_00565]